MTHALQTHDLHRRFGRLQVIRGLDLAVPQGSIYGFLGRNGAGKSTTLRMLLGILPPDSGTIELGGRVARRIGARERQRIGYVSQIQHFHPWMRVSGLGRFVGAFYPTWERARFASLLDRLAIDPRQKVGLLSGGTRTKLAAALALAHRPPLLILDEPTAGVDPVTRRELLDLLRDAATDDGTTVLFSTHNISEVEAIGEQVGILHEGRMFYQGSLPDLQARVRRVAVLPAGATALAVASDGTIGWAEPEVWAGVETRRVGLEEAFVAIARSDA